VVSSHHPLRAQVTVKASAIVPARSAVLRGPKEREVLDLLTARLAAVSLAGYIFFGSSVNISDQARCSLECLLFLFLAWLRVGVARRIAFLHCGSSGWLAVGSGRAQIGSLPSTLRS